MHADVVGIVLAGGRSTRLAPLGAAGGKAAVIVDGEPSLTRVCRTLAAVASRVLVVAAPGQPLPPLDGGVAVVRDTTPHGGPLAGLRDGLAHAATWTPPPTLACVAACDVPLLSAAVVQRLVDVARSTHATFVVPVIGGHPQVLTAVITCDLADTIRPLAAAGRGIRAVLDDLVARRPEAVRTVAEDELAALDPGLRSFLDIDTPEDLARLDPRGIPPSGR